jgi:predicted secreted Zn-dependent protease
MALTGLMGVGAALWMRIPSSPPPVASATPTDEPTVALDLTPIRAFPHTTIHWYDVPGTDTPAIHAYMQIHGSVDGHDGTIGEGWTKWRMNWRYPVSAAGCDTSQVQVSFSGEVTLPHFTDLTRMDAAHQAGWTRYLNALVIHEAGHIGHAYQHVDDVAAAIRGKTCADAGAAAQAAIDTLGQYDAEYDRQTRHGGAQGVIYPN